MESNALSSLENLPIEIKDQIFKYLSSADIISLTLVSKNLNESVGHCRKCMERFWVKFYSFNLKDLDSLEASCRQYVKLKINRVKTHEHFNYLINLNQSWKKILIYNCEFKYVDEFFKLVSKCAQHAEELEITDIEILCYDNFKTANIKFPAIKRVMLRNIPTKTLEIFVGSCSSLEIATFDIGHEVVGFTDILPKIIHNFLTMSPKLKHLQLGPDYIKALFSEENLKFNFNFKLTHLLLKFPIANDLSDDSYPQIVQFLKNQQNIEWIIAMELLNDDILHLIWNEMPSIRRVSFLGLVELFDLEMPFTLEPKKSVKKLDLISRKVLISQLGKLLRAAPNLDELHVCLLNKYMIKTIAKESSIKILYYEHIEEDVMEVYQQLKTSEENVNGSIVLIKKSFWFDEKDVNPFSLDPVFWRK